MQLRPCSLTSHDGPGIAQPAVAQRIGLLVLVGVFFLSPSTATAQRFGFLPKPEDPVPYSMAQAFAAAYADLESLEVDERHFYRYLARPPHYSDRQWLARVRVLYGHINKLSRGSIIYFPELCGGGNLLRVNIYDTGWDKVWDKLQPPHTLTPVIEDHWVEQGYTDARGKWIVTKSYIKGKRVVHRPAELTKVSPSSPKIVDDIYNWTGSYVTVVRADWWLNESAIEEFRVVGYYDWRGLEKRDNYFDQVGFRAGKPRRRTEAREAVSKSGVGRQPRAVVREGAEDGGFWKTFDFLQAIGPDDPLVVYGRDIEQAFLKTETAASEWLGIGPNGFIIEWLEDNKGNRQDSAPDFVGHDKTTPSTDGKIHVGLCMRCHFNGLHIIKPYIGETYKSPVGLYEKDPHAAKLLREHYTQNINKHIARDNARYAEAVLEATGLTVKDFHAQWASMFEEVEERTVDVAYAARELGYTDVKDFQLRLQYYAKLAKTTGGVHPSLAWAVNDKGAQVIPIRNWWVAMPVMYNTVRAIKLKGE